MDLLGRPLDGYDWLMFAAGLALLLALMALVLFTMGLPGRVAIQRKHPHAESVKIMGWMGFLAVVPWVHAFMWAFHDSVTIDLRRYPEEEREAIKREIERLTKDWKKKPVFEEDAPDAETTDPEATDARPRPDAPNTNA